MAFGGVWYLVVVLEWWGYTLYLVGRSVGYFGLCVILWCGMLSFFCLVFGGVVCCSCFVYWCCLWLCCVVLYCIVHMWVVLLFVVLYLGVICCACGVVWLVYLMC